MRKLWLLLTWSSFSLLVVVGAVRAVTPGQLAFCGGYGQRACCLSEAFPSCDGSLAETGAVSGTCPGFPPFPAGTCGYNNPNSLSACGGNGQRACCVGETAVNRPCDTGNVQLVGLVGGKCASPALAPGANAGTCWKPTACGAEGERACSVFEQVPSCDAGLIEIGGCNDFLSCGGSSGWCFQPTTCGGDGQRACCGLLDIAGAPVVCGEGLVPVTGVVGDASCGIGNLVGNPPPALETCIDPDTIGDDIAEPATGWSSAGAGAPACDTCGYADLHGHMFAHLAHGGGVLAGKPYDESGGVNEALKPDYGVLASELDLVSKSDQNLPFPVGCNPVLYPDCGDRIFHVDHLILDDGVGVGTHEGPPVCSGLACGAASNFGAPLFTGWPTWRSTTHQQMYYRWLERAWRGGLRLMVQYAVNNEALCRGSKHVRDTDCADEMAPVDAQIEATEEFESFVDDLSGGPGRGWFRIVRTPFEARQVIAEGKLAVVQGIEVANLFNCKKHGCSGKEAGETDADYVRRKVDEYYAKGVRVVFPIHNFDNAFGGPATWQNAIDVGNKLSEGDWWNAEDCPGEGYGFKIGQFSTWVVQFFAFGAFGTAPIHAGDASCNARGLTPLGETLIRYLMERGMVVDVDHMSNKSLTRTLDIAEELDRPVIASHVQFFDLNKEEIRHERMRTRAQLERIRDGGGMVAAMLKDDVQDTDNVGKKLNAAYTSSPTGKIFKDDCRHSSKTWAQMYQYAVDTMQGPVAMGSDFNGVAGHVGPRFGYDACGQDHVERSVQGRAGNELTYPFVLPGFGTFQRQVTGKRTFDFNVDGLAHAGLLPDLVADLKKIGLSDADLLPLFRSADGFVNVWERAQGGPGSANPCVPGPTTLCLNDGRFQVDVSFRTAQGGTGDGHAVELTPDTGYFWFFDPANVEIVVKVLDACDTAFDRFWAFAAGLTDLEVEISVTDTSTGEVKTYYNPLKTAFQPIQDTNAFATCGASASVAAANELHADLEVAPPAPIDSAPDAALFSRQSECVPNATTLCLNQNRFRVEVDFETAQGSRGEGKAVELTQDTGYFWFFDDENVEIVLKVLDACGPAFQHYWVFAAGLTDVEVDVTVTDVETGEVNVYHNPQATPFQPIQDTGAFATCP